MQSNQKNLSSNELELIYLERDLSLLRRYAETIVNKLQYSSIEQLNDTSSINNRKIFFNAPMLIQVLKKHGITTISQLNKNNISSIEAKFKVDGGEPYWYIRQREAQKQIAVINRIVTDFRNMYQDEDLFLQSFFTSKEYNVIKSTNEEELMNTLKNGFKALQAAYPDGQINDDLIKVMENPIFNAFFEACIRASTTHRVDNSVEIEMHGLSLLNANILSKNFNDLVQKSTEKKNFASVINEQKQNAGQGQHQR